MKIELELPVSELPDSPANVRTDKEYWDLIQRAFDEYTAEKPDVKDQPEFKKLVGYIGTILDRYGERHVVLDFENTKKLDGHHGQVVQITTWLGATTYGMDPMYDELIIIRDTDRKTEVILSIVELVKAVMAEQAK